MVHLSPCKLPPPLENFFLANISEKAVFFIFSIQNLRHISNFIKKNMQPYWGIVYSGAYIFF